MAYERLVLFGAGASFASPGILPVSPPLGGQLYGMLARAFPGTWGALGARLQRGFEAHFETGMAMLWSLYPKALAELKPGAPSPHLLMQDMARFFLSFRVIPGQHDLYSKLLLELHKTGKLLGTRFATLNYEHLLEQAMRYLKLRPQVLRPHGGCQFWVKRGGKLFSQGRALGQGLHCISSRIKPLPAQATADLLNVPQQAQYPCMAIYVQGKLTQMGQRYLWRVQARFGRRALSARSVALIGVRPWVSDTHIWGPIIKTEGRVLYVGGENDYQQLVQHRGNRRFSAMVSNNFQDALGDLVRAI